MSHAIKFSGNNYLEQSFQQENATGLTDFTIQCWLKTTESGPLFHHHSQKNGTHFSVAVTDSGALIFTARSNSFEKSIHSIQGGINNGKWSYLSAIKSGDELTIIINGEIIATTQIDTASLPDQFVEGVLVGKSLGNENNEQHFNGELGGIAIWNRDLSTGEVMKYYQEPVTGNEDGLLSSHPFEIEEDQQDATLKQNGCYVELPLQKVVLKIINNSPHEFSLSCNQTGEFVSGNWPQTIPRNTNKPLKLLFESSHPCFTACATYLVENCKDTDLKIEVNKSLTFYNSDIQTIISDDLERQISVDKNKKLALCVNLRLSENLVVVNTINLNNFLQDVKSLVEAGKVVTSMNYDTSTRTANSTAKQIVEYNQACQLFNRRIQEKPLAIVYCTNSGDVQRAYCAAINNKLPIRVRTGGHDHEGECSGTNTILIDLIGLNGVNISTLHSSETGLAKIATIGPGNRFITLTSTLAQQNVMLPHGTCATVAIPGFTMGGGWGPFTRSQGMCCEHLIGAEIIFGDGSIETIASETLTHSGDGRDIRVLTKNKPELLWALKGGGGMSYGIVTNFYFRTFNLPRTLVRFELEWNPFEPQEGYVDVNTLKILTCWEDVINSRAMPHLTGTNLKINGKPLKITGYKDDEKCIPEYEDFDADTVIHNCVMYGYWEGTGDNNETLKIVEDFIKEEFTDHGAKPADIRLDGIGGLGSGYNPNLEAWGRESHSNVLLRSKGKEGTPYPPDLDEPAPHKITCRLVDSVGLGAKGHKELLRSLTSKLILEGNREKGLFTYVTLGAIAGDYYHNMSQANKNKSSFPYKDKQYIIQYQTWWNLELAEKEELQNNAVYTRINRALDWMEKSRDFCIANTSGSFISFKDSSIPTKTYFDKSYDQLKCVKKKYSKDPDNHFRTRKTII
ncbi:MAG: hypothetical protein ACJAYF_000954 [Arenicella sp.]|jgi:hypothetical protein